MSGSACPTCKRDVSRSGNKYFPFCGNRCQMADLGKWLNEEYRIPADDSEIEDEQPKPEKHRG